MNRKARKDVSIGIIAAGVFLFGTGTYRYVDSMRHMQELPFYERISEIQQRRYKIKDEMTSDPLRNIRLAIDDPVQKERYAMLLREYDALENEKDSLRALPEWRAAAENNHRQNNLLIVSGLTIFGGVFSGGMGFLLYPHGRKREEEQDERRFSSGHNTP